MRPGHHLVSPEAESLLAQACENEANNAKRMRMGLDPISTVVGSLSNCTHPFCLIVSEDTKKAPDQPSLASPPQRIPITFII